MADVIGFLRKDATHGEKQTLSLLGRNLPKECTVYVESPIHKSRDIRYPDFVVVTNYGVIVLEAKDWVTVLKADPSGATVRDRIQRTDETLHAPHLLDVEVASVLRRYQLSGELSAEEGALLVRTLLGRAPARPQLHGGRRDVPAPAARRPGLLPAGAAAAAATAPARVGA